MEVVVTTGTINCAKLLSNRHHQQTNTQFFTGQMPFLSPNQQCQSTEGKNITFHKTCLPQVHLGVFQLCLWPLIAPGYLGGVAMPFISPLMPVLQDYWTEQNCTKCSNFHRAFRCEADYTEPWSGLSVYGAGCIRPAACLARPSSDDIAWPPALHAKCNTTPFKRKGLWHNDCRDICPSFQTSSASQCIVKFSKLEQQ